MVNLLNVGPSAQVNWTTTTNMSVNSGQGTPAATIKAASASTSATGAINATITGCQAVQVPQKPVWVGKPYDFLVQGATLVTAGSVNYYNVVKWGTPPNSAYPTFSEQGVISPTGFTWSFGWPATNAGWECWGCMGEYITIQAGSLSTVVTAHVTNTCGTRTRNYEVFVQQENCPPGGCEEPFFVYPNPSSEEISVSSKLANGETPSEVKLVDSEGTVVYKGTSNGEIKIPVSGLKKGIYFLRVNQNGTTKQQRVIIGQ